jgi:hypothetical protein
MSLRSTKSRISGKIAAGGFKQPDNTLTKAIDTGAGIMAKGIMKRGEEEREEKRVAKREAAAEAKRLAAAQAKKEAEARKNQRIATSIATRFGIEPTNTAAMAYVTNEVEIHGTDALGVVQKDFEDRNANLPTVEVTEEYVTGASANQAPPWRLNVNNADGSISTTGSPDGSISTTLGIGADIDDLEATDPKQAELERSELNLNPQQLNTGVVQTATTTSQGFEFNPLAKKSKIDWANISSEEVDKKLTLHNSGAETLNEEDLKKANDLQAEFAKNEVPTIENQYLAAGSINAITAALSQVENDSRIPEDRKTALKKSLIANRDDMLAAAAAARNSTKNANKTPEVMALEAYMETEAFKKMTAGEKAALTVNFGSIFKPTYSSVEEAIAAYNTANTLGVGYESQVSRIEAVINKAYGGNSERVFAVDDEGFGRIYFVSKTFDPETNSVATTTASGDSLPTNIIPMADYDAKEARSERKAIESGLTNYNNSVASFLTLSSTMADIVDIARQNDGVLTWTAKTMKNIATVTGEVDTFLSVLNGMKPNSDSMITREAYEEQLKAKGLLGKNETLDTLTLDATPPTTLTSWVFGGDDNQLIAARRALEAKLALAPFKVGNAEGTTGTAMSNQDRDLFMKFLTVFRGADGLEKNFVEYLNISRDELDSVVQRFLPGSSEFESFKDSYGYYPAKGFAKTLSEHVEDHPNTEKFSRILKGLDTGSISSQSNNKPPAITLEKFRSDFLKLNPVINMTQEIEDIILENYNLQYGGAN